MRQVSAYVRMDYQKVFRFTSVQACRKTLIENDALAVFEEEDNSFVGILTPKDVIERPHVLVADCFKSRTPVEPEWPVSKVFDSMLKQNINVLPVVSADNNLYGLVYKRDLMKAVWDKKEHLTIALNDSVKKTEYLSASSALLQEVQNNLDDLQLLVSPGGDIIFHNRGVDQYMLACHRRSVSSGDSINILFGHYFGINAHTFTPVFNSALAGEVAFLETETSSNNDKSGNIYKVWCRPVRVMGELKGIAITITDITQQKTKDKLLMEQKSALKTVMFTESHIIRRPLSNILALIELFDTANLSANNAELLQLLKISAGELDDSIKNSTQMLYSTYSKLA